MESPYQQHIVLSRNFLEGYRNMPPVRPARGAAKKKRRGGDDDDYYGGRDRPLIKPHDQEKLTDIELKEEFVRSLTTYDALKPRNLVVWDNKEGAFTGYMDQDPCVFLFTLDSELLSKEGTNINDPAGQDLIDDDSDNEVEEGFERPVVVDDTENKRKIHGLSITEEGTKDDERENIVSQPEPTEDDEGDEGGAGDASEAGKNKKLLNQFNFCERSSQTAITKLRSHQVQTEPPPQNLFKDSCNLWVIYDAYMADAVNRPRVGKHGGGVDLSGAAGGGDEHRDDEVERKPIIKEVKKDKEVRVAERARVKMRKESLIEGQAASGVAYIKSNETLRYLERLVAVNIYDDILYDFKYFEDTSDAYREEGEGTVLPLWRFMFDKVKRKHVTCISWSVQQPDSFAVSYGSFSFIHPVQTGLVILYSIRNPLFPEHVWQRDKGALCCQIHPERNCLVCVGLADGNVVALNIERDDQNESQADVFENLPLDLKHHGPVWGVRWGPDDMDGNPTLLSAGMDGKIMHWTLGLPDLEGNGGLDGIEIASLILPQPAVDGPDGTTYKMFGCARCVVFHPTEITTLLIGTAEGKIFISSSLYGNRLLKIFDAHYLPVAAIQWNHYHFEIFISCSEDWTVKVWDRRDLNPLFTFETGVPIMDVCWAPYSSSVFGCITLEGKILIYDLNILREKPICTQQVATKKKIHPHRMQFNPFHPIVVVGDDMGSLLTLKLSPNLRILPKDTRGIFLEGDVRINWQINKLNRIIRLVRDPSIVVNPKPEELPLLTNLAEIPGQLSRLDG